MLGTIIGYSDSTGDGKLERLNKNILRVLSVISFLGGLFFGINNYLITGSAISGLVNGVSLMIGLFILMNYIILFYSIIVLFGISISVNSNMSTILIIGYVLQYFSSRYIEDTIDKNRKSIFTPILISLFFVLNFLIAVILFTAPVR